MKAAGSESPVGYIYYTTNTMKNSSNPLNSTLENSSTLRTGLISSAVVVVVGIIAFGFIVLVKKYYSKQRETGVTLEEMTPHSSHQSGTYLVKTIHILKPPYVIV